MKHFRCYVFFSEFIGSNQLDSGDYRVWMTFVYIQRFCDNFTIKSCFLFNSQSKKINKYEFNTVVYK